MGTGGVPAMPAGISACGAPERRVEFVAEVHQTRGHRLVYLREEKPGRPNGYIKLKAKI